MELTNPRHSGNVEVGHGSIRRPRGEEVDHVAPLDDILKKLTPADQRLLRELAYKLALLHGLEGHAVPSEYQETPDLRGYIDIWISSLLVQGRSPQTILLYRSYVEMLLREHPHPTHDDIEAFLARRVSQVGAGALGNSIFAIKNFFSYLARKGAIAASPMQYIKAPPRPREERDIPSANTIARLLNAPGITPKESAIILVLAACGLRAAELLGARRADVDLEKLRITVVGKGNKQRTVPMTQQTARALENHLRSLPPSSPWLFPGTDPMRPFTRFALDERFAILSERAGTPRVTPHQLRHYFASTLLNAGVSLIIVSQLLGHANPSITAKVYWHLLEEKERIRAYEQHDPLQEINEEIMRIGTGQLSFDFKLAE